MAKSGDKGKKPKKGKGKGKDAKRAKAGVSVAAHPRASAAVKRSKGFGGMAGFALAAYLSYKAGVPSDQIALRGLAFGVAGYMVAWACSVTVWRHLVMAELRHAIETGRATYALPEDTNAGGRGRRQSAPAAETATPAEQKQGTNDGGDPAVGVE
ncbi:MAG: hypothetical protein ACRDL5_15230 [Solirubrobacteraceae bacterium]